MWWCSEVRATPGRIVRLRLRVRHFSTSTRGSTENCWPSCRNRWRCSARDERWRHLVCSPRGRTEEFHLYRPAPLEDFPLAALAHETIFDLAEVNGAGGHIGGGGTPRRCRRYHGQVGESAGYIAADDIDHHIGGQMLGQQRLRPRRQSGANGFPA